MIYILEGSRPEVARVEVYELDHETPNCLFLKVRGGISKKVKRAFGFRWYRSEEELRLEMRSWINREINATERRLVVLRGIVEVESHAVPPNATPRRNEIKI